MPNYDLNDLPTLLGIFGPTNPDPSNRRYKRQPLSGTDTLKSQQQSDLDYFLGMPEDDGSASGLRYMLDNRPPEFTAEQSFTIPNVDESTIPATGEEQKAIADAQKEYTSSLGRFASFLKDPNNQGSDNLEDTFTSNINAQKDYLSGVESQLKAALQRKDSVDLSPLIGLTDTWTGSDLSKYYQKPNQKQQIAEMQSNLLKGQGNLIDSLRGRERDKMNNAIAKEQIMAHLEAKRMQLESAKKQSSEKDESRDTHLKVSGDKYFRNNYEKTYVAADGFFKNANDVLKVISEDGIPLTPTSKNAGRYNSAMNSLVIFINKYIAELGALAGPDKDIIDDIVGYKQTSKFNPKVVIDAINKLKQQMSNNLYTNYKQQKRGMDNKNSAVYGSRDSFEAVWKPLEPEILQNADPERFEEEHLKEPSEKGK